jgi:hypothetical protein
VLKIAKDLLVEHEPHWLKLMKEAATVLKEYGYISQTWWRPRCKELILAAMEEFSNKHKSGKS